MKQHITIDQLNELGKEEIAKLQSWYNKMPYECVVFGMSEESQIKERCTHPLLSIGQMIEFLEKFNTSNFGGGPDWQDICINYPAANLCDALWKAVKEVLEEKND